MWSYYGSKCKLAKLYPEAKYPTIVEPFAGAAWYSVLHRHKQVILNESYDVIYAIWKWLITSAAPEEILRYVNLYLGQNISTLPLPEPHKDLIGYIINRGCTRPANIVTKWSCQSQARPTWASTPYSQLTRIARLLPEIKHWTITYGDYSELPNIQATWFIDPPYQFGGKFYPEHNINYPDLAKWCKSRKGQVIVCENSQATWLDFKPLAINTGQRKTTTEMMWYKI